MRFFFLMAVLVRETGSGRAKTQEAEPTRKKPAIQQRLAADESGTDRGLARKTYVP